MGTYSELWKIIIGFTCVGVFVATSAIALLHLVGLLKVKQGDRLFVLLIVEVVTICVAQFSHLINLNPAPVVQELKQAEVVRENLEQTNQVLSRIESSAIEPEAKATPLRPRVYIHIASASQNKSASIARDALRSSGNLVPGIENVGAKSPSKTELRYFKPEEEAGAKSIVSVLQAAGVNAVPVLITGLDTSRIRPNHYELWFPRS